MLARLFADTDLIHAYGSASSGHAADLQAVAARLTALGTASASMFGPAGARFHAVLTRAVESEARRVNDLGAAIATSGPAAWGAAHAYAGAEADAGNRLTGSW